MKILLVSSEDQHTEQLARELTSHDFECQQKRFGKDLLRSLRRNEFDVIVLDRLLPDSDGLVALQNLRQEQIDTPVLMISAHGSSRDTVASLEAGADDYLARPFTHGEFQARLRALHRRANMTCSHRLTYQDLVLDLVSRRLTRSEIEISLTPTELSIVEILLRSAGQVVSRSEICEALGSPEGNQETNVLEVHISRLRKKVDRNFSEGLIQTIRGIGYRLGE